VNLFEGCRGALSGNGREWGEPVEFNSEIAWGAEWLSNSVFR